MDVAIDTLPAVRKDYLILFYKDNTITNKRNNKKNKIILFTPVRYKKVR